MERSAAATVSTMLLHAEPHPLDHAPLLGEIVGAYRLAEPIGSGAMGAVYRGYHVESGREVAVKVLRERPGSRDVHAERLRREAAAMGALDHPNIARVDMFGTTADGRSYMVMELLRGRTLAAILADEGALPWVRVARLVREIARGLGAAHAKGFVHRDLKPGNVMVLDGPGPERIKLLDFGIVSVMSDPRTRLTHDGMVLGTPTYMAPEQIMAGPIDHHADLYALGVVAFELLTGRPPFDGSFREIAAQHLLTAPEPLPDCGSLERLTHRLLAKDARDRPSSAMAVVAEIDDMGAPTVQVPGPPSLALIAERPLARASSILPRVAAPPLRRRWAGGGAALLVASIVGVGLLYGATSDGRGVVVVEALPERSEMIAPTPAATVVSALALPVVRAPTPAAEPGTPERAGATTPERAGATTPERAGATPPERAGATPEQSPTPARVPTAARTHGGATYAAARDRLAGTSRRLTAVASRSDGAAFGQLSELEEAYLELSAALQPGRDGDHYQRIIGRIDALDRALGARR